MNATIVWSVVLGIGVALIRLELELNLITAIGLILICTYLVHGE
jgi:hypothetical protein